MEALLLKKTDLESDKKDIVVFDEIIAGMISDELFVPVFTGSDLGMRVIPLSYLIDNYSFSKKARCLHYLKGSNPGLFKKVVYHEDNEIEIETCP